MQCPNCVTTLRKVDLGYYCETCDKIIYTEEAMFMMAKFTCPNCKSDLWEWCTNGHEDEGFCNLCYTQKKSPSN